MGSLLAAICIVWYLSCMSTVAEIEAAIEKLPSADQGHLQTWLHSRTRNARATVTPHLREVWLKKLARLRSNISTGKITSSTEAHLDDLCSERSQ